MNYLVIIIIVGWIAVVIERLTETDQRGIYFYIHNTAKLIGIVCILLTFGYIVHVLL